MVPTPYHSDFITVCWFLYLIRTADNRLYTGITTDVPRRFRQHQAGKGAKALRGKGDLQLAFSHEVGEHSLALRLEYRPAKNNCHNIRNGLKLYLFHKTQYFLYFITSDAVYSL